MNTKTKLGTATALAVACSALFSGAAETNRTYTVTVPGWDGKPLWTHTNCIEVRKHEAYCVLVRYVDGKVTNEFHAFAVPVHVTTNKVSRR